MSPIRTGRSAGPLAWFGLLTLGLALASPALGQNCPIRPPAEMRLTAPQRMDNGHSLTIKAELLDVNGNIAWRQWDPHGTVSVVRVSDQAPVAISMVLFDSYGSPPPPGSISFYNGIGCATFLLTSGTAEPAGDIEVTVTLSGSIGGEGFTVSDSRIVTVVDNPPLREMSGTLSGSELTWSPSDGIVHVTGNVTVASGDTLTIEPGTLVMVEAGAPANGTRIDVNGSVQSVGTQQNPIFLFPASGAPALKLMDTCDDPRYNPDAWRGILHSGSATSTYEHVFLTGAGNGPSEGHTRPPVMRFVGEASFNMARSVLAYNNGKALHGAGSGDYQVTRSVVAHCGHGAEWTGTGDYSLVVEDTWFTRIGRAPEACDYDGDCMNIRSASGAYAGDKVVRRCVFTDGGDDAIDTKLTSPAIESCLFWNLRDKGISMEGEGVLPVMYNLLIFDVAFATDGHRDAGEGPGSLYALTNATVEPRSAYAFVRVMAGTTIDRCIVWPVPHSTCSHAIVNHCVLGLGSNTGCGSGNLAVDPEFLDVGAHDYRLRPGSPARQNGPNGEQVGWLGFPYPFLVGDNDSDGDIDLRDYEALADCLAGPEAAQSADCLCFDFDQNGVVDIRDYAAFQAAFTS